MGKANKSANDVSEIFFEVLMRDHLITDSVLIQS